MKITKRILAFMLTLTLLLQGTARVLADNAKPVYISDVMVGMGETAEEAKKALTDAGFTVLDQNVNEGAGSAFKTEKYVYIGYKTTENSLEAITDLAVMNMNGGYSFSDYKALMDKYRDSQIRPFIDNFIATIKEYRANYESDNEANRAKAAYAYSVLSHIIDDDCGNNLAELLLNPTREELGLSDDAYKALSEEEKRNTIDLTTALMQGNGQVVFLMEQVLAMAADTNETTWLERLSELGPDGLEEQYAAAGVRPSDASREMASLYNDTAKTLLSSWEDMRTALLDYEVLLAEEGIDADEVVEEGSADVTEAPQVGVGDIDPNDVDVTDPGEMLDMISRSMESSMDIAETAAENRMAAVYAALREISYGEDTMLDFFTKPYAEVSGENISALYPMASTLTSGQTAAIDFLPMELILQIGVTDGNSYVDCGSENSDLLEVIEKTGKVSIFLNVNREIFGNTTALTSEALREQTLSEKGWTDPDSDLLGLSRLTTLSWAATGVSLVVTLLAAYKASHTTFSYSNMFAAQSALSDFAAKTQNTLTGWTTTASIDYNLFQVTPEALAQEMFSSMKFGATRTANGVQVSYTFNIETFKQTTDIGRKFINADNVNWSEQAESFGDSLVMSDNSLSASVKQFGNSADSKLTVEVSSDVAKRLKLDKVDDVEGLNNQIDQAQQYYAKGGKWNTLKKAGMVITAILAVASIIMTVYDLYRYYNIDYTPIPQYIVDEADITVLDEGGSRLVTRNDTAYYAVAKTNRPETHEQYRSLQDYADLNGDVGQQWLALYSVKQTGGEPILANSLKVVTGSTSLPEGYSKGIHMFGSSAAANLTDSRYTYNDDLNGLYVYYKTAASAASSATGSVFSRGALALVGAGGAIFGAALGALVTVFVKKKKEEPRPV